MHAVVVVDEAALARAAEGDPRKAIQREMQALAKDLPSYHRLQAVHLWREPLPRAADGTLGREEIARRVQEESERPPARAAAPAAAMVAGPANDEELLEELARLSGISAADIRAESDLYGDLGLDSIEAIELLLFLETALRHRRARRESGHDPHRGRPAARGRPRLPPLPMRRRGSRTCRRCAPPPIAPRSTGRSCAARSPPSAPSTGATSTCARRTSRGRCRNRGPYIIAANHSSHLDVGAIMAAVTARRGRAEAERLHVLGARDYFFNKPLKSWFFSRFFNVVPIRREQTGLDGLRTAKGILAKGEPVLIFPEATRSRSGKMQTFKPGLGLLAYEANVPVIPAYIQGTYQALPAGKVIPKALPLKIKFGAPLSMEETTAAAAPARPATSCTGAAPRMSAPRSNSWRAAHERRGRILRRGWDARRRQRGALLRQPAHPEDAGRLAGDVDGGLRAHGAVLHRARPHRPRQVSGGALPELPPLHSPRAGGAGPGALETLHCSRGIFPAAIERVRMHRERHDPVVLVTGSLRPLVAPLAAYLGADDLIAADLEVRSGGFTGALVRGPLSAARKAAAVRAWAVQHGLDPAACSAYADSLDDVPMLRAVGHAHAVNPAPRLERLALEAGWAVMRWERS